MIKLLIELTDNIFLGVGGVNPQDQSDIIPTATFVAHPGMTCTIFPKVVFYVSTGEFTPGTLIDVTSVETTSLKVDFETGLPDRTFIHKPNGTFVLE